MVSIAHQFSPPRGERRQQSTPVSVLSNRESLGARPSTSRSGTRSSSRSWQSMCLDKTVTCQTRSDETDQLQSRIWAASAPSADVDSLCNSGPKVMRVAPRRANAVTDSRSASAAMLSGPSMPSRSTGKTSGGAVAGTRSQRRRPRRGGHVPPRRRGHRSRTGRCRPGR